MSCRHGCVFEGFPLDTSTKFFAGKAASVVLSGFRSLAVRNYRYYFFAQLASNVGTWIQRIAQDWLVLDLSNGSGLALGVTVALQTLPTLVLSLWSGKLADRVLSKRRLIILTQSGMGVSTMALGALTLWGVSSVSLVCLFALVLGVLTVIESVSRKTLVVELVGKELVPNAVALSNSLFQIGRVVGPVIAVALIHSFGYGYAFLSNAVSFFLVVGALLAMRGDLLKPDGRSGPAASVDRSIRGGIKYVWRRRDLVALLALTFSLAPFATNIQTIVALVVAHFDSSTVASYGTAATALAIGAVIGSLVSAYASSRSLSLVTCAYAAYSAALVGSNFMPSFVPYCLTLAALGVAFPLFSVGANSIFQLSVDPDFRGRSMSLYQLAFRGGTPIGALVVGALADWQSPAFAGIVAGTIPLLALVIIVPFLRSVGGVSHQEPNVSR